MVRVFRIWYFHHCGRFNPWSGTGLRSHIKLLHAMAKKKKKKKRRLGLDVSVRSGSQCLIGHGLDQAEGKKTPRIMGGGRKKKP